MELSVTVRGLKGGEGLTIRIELQFVQAGEEQAVASDVYWFTANQLAAWAVENGLGKRAPGQGVTTFGVLYEAARTGAIKVAHECSREQCRGRACRGVHNLAGDDYALLSDEVLNAVYGIGPDRLEIVTQYRDYWHERVFGPTAEV
jgi:hypothetical protein